jgi:pSer/pThr/pTyr-binding forkhead associated (FHA) protein
MLGRSPDCQVIVNYPNVSAHHARLHWDGQQFVVEDLGSTNGTFVNGHRLTGPVLFRPGDVLSLGGSVELVLQAGG